MLEKVYAETFPHYVGPPRQEQEEQQQHQYDETFNHDYDEGTNVFCSRHPL